MKQSQNPNQGEEKAEQALSFIQECPVCDLDFEIDGARILRQKGNVSLVHITCQECLSSVLAVVLMTDIGASSLGILTDLEPEDVLKQEHAPNLNHDHILELHQLLEDKNKFESAIMAEAPKID
ncbi:MAG: hypothetical protein ABEJ02_01425 [Candidatus Paceibacteria bacterium]